MADLFAEHRSVLFGIAYRMLGRVGEAEDMVQETWLRWQRLEDVSKIQSPRAWLATTITRLSIDQLRSAQRQREEYYGVWLPEPLVEAATPSPDKSAELADSLTMAFMFMLETLSPLERAVFILREVFDYDYAEIAAIVEKNEANCRQIINRAKSTLARNPPTSSTPSARANEVVQKFRSACSTGHVDELLLVLAGDATLYTDGGGRVSAAGRPIRTADHISRFFAGIHRRQPGVREYRVARVNGRAGLLMCIDGGVCGTLSFDIDGDRIRTIYLVRNPDKLHSLKSFENHDCEPAR